MTAGFLLIASLVLQYPVGLSGAQTPPPADREPMVWRTGPHWLPGSLRSITRTFSCPGHQVTLHLNYRPEGGGPGGVTQLLVDGEPVAAERLDALNHTLEQLSWTQDISVECAGQRRVRLRLLQLERGTTIRDEAIDLQ